MDYIRSLFEFIQKLLVWWVIISPWEQGIRVRGGKHVRVLEKGTHLRIPFFDSVFVQAIRLRIATMSPQTVSTKDGKTLTIVVAVGYSISNIEQVYQTMSNPEATICNLVMGEMADYIGTHTYEESTPALIEANAFEKLSKTKYGIAFEYLKITGYAIVRTYRVIQDGHWVPSGLDVQTPIK